MLFPSCSRDSTPKTLIAEGPGVDECLSQPGRCADVSAQLSGARGLGEHKGGEGPVRGGTGKCQAPRHHFTLSVFSDPPVHLKMFKRGRESSLNGREASTPRGSCTCVSQRPEQPLGEQQMFRIPANRWNPNVQVTHRTAGKENQRAQIGKQ